MVTLATAHPAKFPEAVVAASGIQPRLPERYADLMQRPERCLVLDNQARRGRSRGPRQVWNRMIDTVEITTIANGLRVVSETMPRLQTASLGVWIDVGARYEAPEVNGVAHMLEHMAFKGTRRRSARAIAEEIERVGGSLNAYTSREHTAYYARILADDIGLAADILADILQHSTFDPAELEKERHVVLQEIGQVKDTPDDLVFDLLQDASYPDQPMGRAILGPESIVAEMPREALVDYMARHYGPKRMVFAGAGKLEHGYLVELAERLFGELPAAEGQSAQPARYSGGRQTRASPRSRAGALVPRRGGPALSPPRPFCPAGSLDRPRRRDVLAPVPGGAGKSRSLLLDLLLRLRLCRYGPARRLCRHRPGGRARAAQGRRG